MKKNITFNLYPERTNYFRKYWFKKYFSINSNLYFIVRICNSNQEIISLYNKRVPNKDHSGCVAVIFNSNELSSFNNKISKNCIGEIVFSKENLTSAVIAHELTHATMYWLKRKKIKTVIYTTKETRKEHIRQEFACDVNTSLHVQMSDGCYKREIPIFTSTNIYY